MGPRHLPPRAGPSSVCHQLQETPAAMSAIVSVDWHHLPTEDIQDLLYEDAMHIRTFPWHDAALVSREAVLQGIVHHLKIFPDAYRFVPTNCGFTDEQQFVLFDTVVEEYNNALAHAPLCVHRSVDHVTHFLRGNPAYFPPEEGSYCCHHNWIHTQDLIHRAEQFGLAVINVTTQVTIRLVAANPWIMDDPRVGCFRCWLEVAIAALKADWNCHPGTIATSNRMLVSNGAGMHAVSRHLLNNGMGRLKFLPSVWGTQGVVLLPPMLKMTQTRVIVTSFMKLALQPWSSTWEADTQTLAAFSHRVIHDSRLDYRVCETLSDLVSEAEKRGNLAKSVDEFEFPSDDQVKIGAYAIWTQSGETGWARTHLRVQAWSVSPRQLGSFLKSIKAPTTTEDAEGLIDMLAWMTTKMNTDKQMQLIEKKVAELASPTSLLGKQDWSKALVDFADSVGPERIMTYSKEQKKQKKQKKWA